MNTSNHPPFHDENEQKLIDLTVLNNDDDEEEKENIDSMPPLPALGPNPDATQIMNESIMFWIETYTLIQSHEKVSKR